MNDLWMSAVFFFSMTLMRTMTLSKAQGQILHRELVEFINMPEVVQGIGISKNIVRAFQLKKNENFLPEKAKKRNCITLLTDAASVSQLFPRIFQPQRKDCRWFYCILPNMYSLNRIKLISAKAEEYLHISIYF